MKAHISLRWITHCLVVGLAIALGLAGLLSRCGSLPPFFIETPPTLDPLVAALLPSATPPADSSQPPADGSQPPIMAATPEPLETVGSEPPPAEAGHYTVQAGDTLLGIALQYQTSMAAIQLINALGDSTLIQVGQELTIPPASYPDESAFWIVHSVQAGETLLEIGRMYGLNVDDLLRVNAISNPALISIGQPLVIPVDTLAQATTTEPETPPAPAPRPAPQPAPIPLPNPPPNSMAAASSTNTPQPYPPPIAPAVPTPAPTLPPAAAPSGEYSDWANTIIALINQKRAAHGLPGLAASPELMRAAQAHAEDCAQRGWGSHVGSDGASTVMRIKRAGYEATAWGENWVQAFEPEEAVAWWYNETPPNDPHRKNILNTRCSEIGVGITPADNGYYFIADFGQR